MSDTETLRRMTPEEIADFASDYVGGSIYSNADVPQNLWMMVFMPVALGAKAPADAGLIFANVKTDRTFGRSVNGFPMFASCRFMHKADVELAQKAIDKLKAAKQAIADELKAAP